MRRPTRPGLILAAILAFAGAARTDAQLPSARPGSRPNILYCLADDWSYPHAGIYGDRVIRTPNFDRVAREGMLFTRAFSAAPSCTASRAAMLTGRAVHQLEAGAMLWGFLPAKFTVYPDLLEAAGYAVGAARKGWGPGSFRDGDRTRNPAGPTFSGLAEFLKTVRPGQPFSFWFGSTDPHRPYEDGAGFKSGKNPADVTIPAFWPDRPEVRSDILDYYDRAERFDRDVGGLMKLLEEKGLLENTLVVVTGDNGWPFPRAKANLYDAGTRQPLAARWPARFRGGRTNDAFVNLCDIAPTFLDASGLKPPPDMVGQSLLPLLEGGSQPGRDRVFLERERHANVRPGDLSYPMRAVRTDRYLYIRNLRPDRWPAGNPEKYIAVGPFGDCDDGPTKKFILDHRGEPFSAPFFNLCFAQRPAEELYDIASDPDQIHNVADTPRFESARREMRAHLDQWMRETGDPRFDHDDDHWDKYPYFGDNYVKPRPAPGVQ